MKTENKVDEIKITKIKKKILKEKTIKEQIFPTWKIFFNFIFFSKDEFGKKFTK